MIFFLVHKLEQESLLKIIHTVKHGLYSHFYENEKLWGTVVSYTGQSDIHVNMVFIFEVKVTQKTRGSIFLHHISVNLQTYTVPQPTTQNITVWTLTATEGWKIACIKIQIWVKLWDTISHLLVFILKSDRLHCRHQCY